MDERDRFLAHSLYLATNVNMDLKRKLYEGATHHSAKTGLPLPRHPFDPFVTVGVVGIGHVEGIKKYWGKVTPEEALDVCEIPIPSKTERFVMFSIKASFYGMLLYGGYKAATKISGLLFD